MRILIWHCENFTYKPVEKALKDAEEIEIKEHSYNEVLVVLMSVESGDDESMVRYIADEIIRLADDVKAQRVLLYPYAHLSSELAPPEIARELISRILDEIKIRGVECYSAPFGYYKEFVAHVKGHPLAERSRIITKEDVMVERRKREKKYVLVTPRGEEIEPSKPILKKLNKDLRILVRKEALGEALPEKKHEMLEYLRRFGFEWEEKSDFGHQRLQPYASLMFDLAVDYSRSVIRKLGIPIYEVKGTAFFNLKVRAVKEHADLYGDRLYKIKTDRGTFVLRYAACHQQFSILSDWYISYKNLPFGIFEVADSYRYEQSGEVELAFRLRRFWMPDLHIIVSDEEKAKEMLMRVHRLIMDEAEKFGQNYELLVNVVSPEQYDRYRSFIIDLAKEIGKPVLVAIYPPTGLSYYWTINIEYHITDYLGRPREIGTVQIDIGNAERFDINYVDQDGNKKHPTILHSAILGTIIRFIYMLFDRAMKLKASGNKPLLPYWISPIQVRVIPVSDTVYDYAKEVMRRLEKSRVRVDFDDTNRTLSRKILDAEKEWVPYVVVIGEREAKENKITVRIRKEGKQKTMDISEFIEILKEEQDDYPWRDLYFPKYLSQRIRYP